MPYSHFDPSTRFNKRYHHLGVGPSKWSAAKSYNFCLGGIYKQLGSVGNSRCMSLHWGFKHVETILYFHPLKRDHHHRHRRRRHHHHHHPHPHPIWLPSFFGLKPPASWSPSAVPRRCGSSAGLFQAAPDASAGLALRLRARLSAGGDGGARVQKGLV